MEVHEAGCGSGSQIRMKSAIAKKPEIGILEEIVVDEHSENYYEK